MVREWDARTYDSLPLPHTRWGERTIGRLDPRGIAAVLDAGCGTGRDTALLLDRLPASRVVAVDASATMLARLRERLANQLDRVTVIEASLLDPLALDAPVDAITSVATFHWIRDHDRLFRALAALLRPGGQLVVDCGGLGNIASVRRAFVEAGGREPDVWQFSGAAETERRLAESGFDTWDVRLRPDPARLARGAQLESYLATVVLPAHLQGVPEAERPPLVRAVAERLAEPVIDYVRLEITARR